MSCKCLEFKTKPLFKFHTWKVWDEKKLKYWASMTCKLTIYLF
jgi:hypothetical protein